MLQARGAVEIKGKGPMELFAVISDAEAEAPRPSPGAKNRKRRRH